MTSQVKDKSDSYQYYRRLLSHSMAYWKIFAVAVVGMMLVAGTDTAMAAYMKPLMDGAFVERDPDIIRTMPLILVAIFVVRVFAMFISMYGMSWVGRQVVMELRDTMFKRLLHLPKDYYDRATTGEIMSKFTFDVEQVANATTKVITTLIRDSFTIIGLLAWMIYISPLLASMFLFAGPLLILLVAFVSKKFRKVSRRIQGSMGDVSKVLEESIKGQVVVKMFGGQAYEQKQFHTINDNNRRQHMRMIATQSLSAPVMRLIVGIGLAIVIYVATSVGSGDVVSVGTFTSYMVAMALIFAPIKRLSDVNADLQRGLAAAESVFNLIDMHEEKNAGSYQVETVEGDVTFSNVSFRYASSEENALKNININIKAGETVAFVGRSGSGKSTLLNLLPRFYDVTSGSIKLDGHELNEYQLDNLRSHIAYVGQDIVLFNDTIEHNIAYGSFLDTDHEKVEEAARLAYADKFIETMDGGYSAMVGERGVMLSGGQRQRIAIARALLKDAPVLILDEATSALDTESERFIQQSLEILMQNRTTLVIAHRLSTVENADVIVVMDNGEIVESGTHDELIARNGHYAALHQMHFKEPEVSE
ncbi:MAG: lipid A export permease/ATP-binding protein MsbA [Gammaproteobacteria bacterium]|nr:lipid A export permease/ATP-binding protein MsbA [Gammaproteobacteria bacterium]MCW8922191.1 lipid A export permease/ATP-binding protein MsbA [Gammaproteobacteria bacterium]